MKSVVLFFILLSFPVLAQQKPDSLWGGPINVVDGVYIAPFDPCTYDSIARLHTNAQFVLSDSSTLNYSFTEGNTTYLELGIGTKKCRCSDCQSFRKLIVRVDSLNPDNMFVLTPSNCTYIYWNSWIQPEIKSECNGTLQLKSGRVCLFLNPYFDAKRKIWNHAEEIEISLE